MARWDAAELQDWGKMSPRQCSWKGRKGRKSRLHTCWLQRNLSISAFPPPKCSARVFYACVKNEKVEFSSCNVDFSTWFHPPLRLLLLPLPLFVSFPLHVQNRPHPAVKARSVQRAAHHVSRLLILFFKEWRASSNQLGRCVRLATVCQLRFFFFFSFGDGTWLIERCGANSSFGLCCTRLVVYSECNTIEIHPRNWFTMRWHVYNVMAPYVTAVMETIPVSRYYKSVKVRFQSSRRLFWDVFIEKTAQSKSGFFGLFFFSEKKLPQTPNIFVELFFFFLQHFIIYLCIFY